MNPVHTNADWAARAQVFGMPDTVGHGMMTMSTITWLMTRSWGVVSDNGGRVRRVQSKFTKPVKVGEVVSPRAARSRASTCTVRTAIGCWWSSELRDGAGDLVGVSEIQYQLPD